MTSVLGSEGAGQSATQTPASGNPGGTPASTGTQTSAAPVSDAPKSWRDSLPEDIRENPTLKNFSDVANLAKSYIHAQSAIGKKGVIVPGEKASDEDWQNFYKSVGVPELDKYEVKLPQDRNANPETIAKFKEAAHKAGLLPKQAQEMLGWYSEYEANAVKAHQEATQANLTKELDGLKKEWGEGYDKQIALARMAVREVGGNDFVEYMNKSGMGNDPQLIRFMAKMGKALGEDKLRGDTSGRMGGMTPEEINDEINRITLDPGSPYHDSGHMMHKTTVDKVAALYKKLYGD